MKKVKKRRYLTENKERVKKMSDIDARIQRVLKKRWINYPQVNTVLRRLELFYARPRTERMPSMLIYADSGMGKTMLAKKFYNKHPRQNGGLDKECRIPVLYIEVPPSMTDDRDLYIEILTALGAPVSGYARPADLRMLTKNVLRHVDCKILLLDETNNLLAGTPRQLRAMLNALRYLSNQLDLSLVCLGIKSTLNIIAGDDQLANRMEAHALLPLKHESMAKFMKAIVSHYPLYLETDCEDRELLGELFTQTRGNLGKIIPLLQDAAIYAIEKGVECITCDVLKMIAVQPPLVAMQARQQVTA